MFNLSVDIILANPTDRDKFIKNLDPLFVENIVAFFRKNFSDKNLYLRNIIINEKEKETENV